MNSGVNLRRAASRPLRASFAGHAFVHYARVTLRVRRRRRRSPASGLMIAPISAAPRLLRHEDHAREEIHFAVVAQRQRGLVQNPEQQVPQRVRRLFDFVEQHEAELHGIGVILIQHFLRQQRMRLAMSQVSGRRADQLRDLVAVLELGAIDLDDRARILQQRLGGGFDDAGLARAGRPQEQEIPDRTAGRAHPRQIHLIDVDDLLDRLILTDDHSAQAALERYRLSPGFGRIQRDV